MLSALLMGALLTTQTVRAQSTPASAAFSNAGDLMPESKTFEFGLFTGSSGNVNLTLATRQSKRVMITLRNTRNTVIHREYVTRSRSPYWIKFNFENSKAGTYQLEMTDGQQRIVRHIEIANVPRVEPQRYVVYNPQRDR